MTSKWWPNFCTQIAIRLDMHLKTKNTNSKLFALHVLTLLIWRHRQYKFCFVFCFIEICSIFRSESSLYKGMLSVYGTTQESLQRKISWNIEWLHFIWKKKRRECFLRICSLFSPISFGSDYNEVMILFWIRNVWIDWLLQQQQNTENMELGDFMVKEVDSMNLANSYQ